MGVLVSATAPVGAADSALWFSSTNGLLYLRYNDGNSTAWIAVAARAEATP
jgi:hypothetical protein